MIQLQHITKSYQNQIVLSDFNFQFEKCGFYLLFGPSGCGKTTLLNLITGLLTPDSGDIYFSNNLFNMKDIQQSSIAYIMQDSYFIEYLTMKENLLLTSDDKDIDALSNKFHVFDQLLQYPTTLSGGEKQRFSIMQALLSQKEIIVLDEPTACLDKENTKNLFELLHSLKDQVLIICVSHDIVAKQYCDIVIDFHNLQQYREPISINKENSIDSPIKQESNTRDVYSFIKLQKRTKEKYSILLFSLILICEFLILSFSIDPENKLMSMLGEEYHYNYLKIEVPYEQSNRLVIGKDGIISIVYPYNKGANYTTPIGNNEHSVVVQNRDPNLNSRDYYASLTYETLPIHGFYYSNHLAAGTYFKEPMEIMLGYEDALKRSTSIQDLIGSKVIISTPKGKETFKVAGIFLPFEKDSLFYMQGGHNTNTLNSIVYFNEQYTKQYLFDDIQSNTELLANHRSAYTVYFQSFADMMKFYENYSNNTFLESNDIYIYPISNQFRDIIQIFQSLSTVLIPVGLSVMLFSILFYVFSRKSYFQQSIRNLCVYQYYGYTWLNLIKAQIRYITYEILISIFMSALIAIGIGLFGNFINTQFHILSFYPFTLHPSLFLLTSLIIFVLLFLCILVSFLRVKKIPWHTLLKQRRDLL